MKDKLLNLEQEKLDRIINAALKVFAENGYAKASTNEMVKEAGISKGLLFHYFQNKKGLFLFLYDYMYEILMKELVGKVNWEEKDLFLKYKQLATLKLDVFVKYPQMFDFLTSAYFEEDGEVKKEIETRTKDLLSIGYQQFFTDIDYSKFKEGIDVEKAANIVFWSMEGFSNSHQERIKQLTLENFELDEVYTEMDAYLELLKKVFYKE